MLHRLVAGVMLVGLVLAPGALASRPSPTEVVDPDGAALALVPGERTYPADGSVLTIGSTSLSPRRVLLRDVSLLGGRIQASEVAVPATGVAGAHVVNLSVDGRLLGGSANTLVPLPGAGYLVALQEAVVPGKESQRVGIVGLRVYLSSQVGSLRPGSQILVGLARAARGPGAAPRPIARARWSVLGFDAPQVTGLPSTPSWSISAPWDDAASWSSVPLGAAATRGQRVVRFAERFLGVPYVWGGADPSTGFDCSGFTMYVYARFGVDLLHYTGSQIHQGVPVAPQELQPGDLVFFHGGPDAPGHEGVYIGGGRFIHAPHTGDVVKISPLEDYADGYVGAVRPL